MLSHGAPGGRIFQRLRGLPRSFWFSFLAACVFVTAVEYTAEHMIEAESAPGVAQTIFNFSGFYQRVVAAPRDPIPRHTAVVEIDPEKEPEVASLHTICEQRAMMARLLCGVASAQPQVIVVDKFFLPRDCEQDSQLRAAVREISEHTPVVVGRRIMDEGFVQPAMVFPGSQRFSEGVVNVHPDTRRLPLYWRAYAAAEDAERGASAVLWDTLALTAAKAYGVNGRVITSAGGYPYISFLEPRDFPRVTVRQVFAGVPGAPQEGRFCPAGIPSEDLRVLRGKAVLIGELNRDMDEHPTVLGAMSGLHLQANYVEALIDGRHYKGMSVLDYALGFALMVGLELILLVYHDKWLLAGGLILLLFLALGALVLFMTMLLHWYVNPALLGAMVVLIKVLHLAFGRAERAIPHHQVPVAG